MGPLAARRLLHGDGTRLHDAFTTRCAGQPRAGATRAPVVDTKDGIARPDVTDRLGRFERDPSGSYNIYDRNGERIKARSLRRAQARSVRVVDAVFRLGCFAYIPKPVDYVSLEHLVAMACRSI